MKDNLVVITGATGGIGCALTNLVLASGYPCCAIVRSREKLVSMTAPEHQSNLHILGMNERHQLPQLVRESGISVVTLVLCAFQIAPIAPVCRLVEREIADNIEINLVWQTQLIACVTSACRESGKELRVVNLDSGAGYRPIGGWSLYCAAKAYMGMLLRTLAEEEHMPVVLYDPGVVDTAMQGYIRSSDSRDFPDVHMFRSYYEEDRLHAPADVAADLFSRYIEAWTAQEMTERMGNRS